MKMSSIMIVDDSEADHFFTVAIIENFDPEIEIFQAYDGQEALDMLDEMTTPPDIILLDINMPRMNGFEFLEEYSTREKRGNVIAMLTSSDQQRDKEMVAKFDVVNMYFVKPLKEEDLLKIKSL